MWEATSLQNFIIMETGNTTYIRSGKKEPSVKNLGLDSLSPYVLILI